MPQLDSSRPSTAKLLSVTVDGDYYGGSSAAVPFKWESQPGTPSRLSKRYSTSGFNSDSDFISPVSAPLTPPPSYYASPSTKPNPKKTNANLASKHRSLPSSPAASSSSSSSSTSSTSRKHDLYGSKSRGSMWFGSKHHNSKSSGCYASIFKVLLRDVK